MSERIRIINSFYSDGPHEDTRLIRSRHGQMEYLTTMHYIHRYAPAGCRILELGAGTGRYSVALAKENYRVDAVELSDKNYEILRENSQGIATLNIMKGDALDLSVFPDGTFDCVLILGPMYHLYERGDQLKALREAVRVTKAGGIVMAAFLSVHAIMANNYLQGNWQAGMEENFTEDFKVRHFEQQLFTGFQIDEFEALLSELPLDRLTTAATDGLLELAEGRSDFSLPDEAFQSYVRYHLQHCERRELLGSSSHLLCICRKTAK